MRNRVLVLALSLGLGAYAVSSDTAGLGKCWRNVDPAARAKLAEYAKAAEGCRPHVEHSKFLLRGQFFYGLERTNDLHIFYERPLIQSFSGRRCRHLF